MPDQYIATDTRTGLQITITGTFPVDSEDRIRIARTCTLFTRLMATILAMTEERPRRDGFRAVETQLEVADALVRGDFNEVQRLVRETLHTMGVTKDQLREVESQLREQMSRLGQDMPPELGSLFGGLGAPSPDGSLDTPHDDTPDPRYPDDPPPAPKG